MSPAEGDHVLIETGPEGHAALFAAPVGLVTARTRDEVEAALARLDRARRDGYWIAGFAAYEAGYALEPALAGLLDPGADAPLLSFGIFEAPESGEAMVQAADRQARDAAVRTVRPLWSAERHGRAFDEITGMIGRGDLYQVNLTLPVEIAYDGTPEALWGALRRVQPVRHGAVLRLGGVEVISRSPELFFRLGADRSISVAPMKGTAPRGATPAADRALRDGLAADEKNRAENVMIVDLMRNDLSRIAEPGSVRVPVLLQVETYATVHQMVSRVDARLVRGTALPDLFRALFPCGSITGAPKIAAMRAIHRLESGPRGAYCGSVGWLAPDGRAEFNVAIRTLTLTGPGRATLGVGGGIVADSRADAEYEEALWKSRFVTELIPTCA